VANKNFGCGSSREHAPQSLKRWGIQAIIAESYSEIFYGNCVSLAMPCFTADHDTCARIQSIIEDNPAAELGISVSEATISIGGELIQLEIQPGAQGQFLDGSWDARAGLLENLDGVKEVAAKIPYVSNYA
jgi:3-isopropylmalate/(R)-2-methylmalate dehydratase small subunit